MKRTVLLSLVIITSSAVAVCADPVTRYVPDEYFSIQMAIQDSNDGDTVVVRPGLYFELINFSGKNITVTSEDPNDPATVAGTILNGDDDGTVVTFENDETREAVLEGFTINSGYGTYDERFGDQELIWGAGIFIADASPTIRNNVIAENHGPVRMEDPMVMCYGGGLACINSGALVTNNTFYDNSAAAGGAIIVWYGPTELRSNLIYGNSAAIGGGVVLLGGRMVNCTVVNNDADLPGPFGDEKMAGNVYAAAQDESELGRCVIVNNIITNARSGYGLLLASGGEYMQIAFNDIWGNLPADAYGVDPRAGDTPPDGTVDLSGWNGNISEDPLFEDVTDDEFHLLLESPCINAGDPDYEPIAGETDIDGQARIYAVIVDMGADEYVGYIPPVADAGADIHIAEPQSVTLDGTGSYFYDPCGIKIYNWTQIGGPPLDPNDPNNTSFYQVQLSDYLAAQPTFMPGPYGYYRFELKVSDDEYMGRPDRVLVIVGNEKPVARPGIDQVIQVPAHVFLDATESYDPDPTDELTYSWTQIEGPEAVLVDADSPTPHFDCNENGTYVFELIVNDTFEDSLPATVRITTVVVTLNEQQLDLSVGNENPQFYPDISGSRLVCANGADWWHDTWDIKVKDISTGAVSEFTAGLIDTQPRINGDTVVWAASWDDNAYYIYNSIYARNLTNGKQILLRQAGGRTAFSHPAVAGGKVVWLRHFDISEANWQSSPYSICGADITDPDNPAYFTVAENVGTRMPYDIDMYYYDYDKVIDISGDIVVWEAQGNIYGADISNIEDIKVFTICDDPARQYEPAISGNIVVWADERNDSGDIYGADISNPENITEMRILKAPGTQLQPAIDGCLVAYVDGSRYGGTIRVSCITRSSGILDVSLQSYHYGLGPAVDGDTIVYQAGTFEGAAGASLGFGYSSEDGPIENVSTGVSYDYIQHAVSAAGDGETVVVPRGRYTENIRFSDANVTLRSEDPEDPDVVADTVLTGHGTVVSFGAGNEPNCVLTGFTISGGSVGVYCFESKPTISNCLITRNSSHGIELHKASNAIIDRCSIMQNGGSGINMVVVVQGRWTWFNQPTITSSLIAANALDGLSGGGPKLVNCTVVQNGGRGIYSNMRVNSTLANSIVYYNGSDPGTPQILNSRISVEYSDVQGSFAGPGNTDADPQFAAVGYLDHPPSAGHDLWVPGDYRLLTGSPCIDAGDPNTVIAYGAMDLEGNARLAGAAVDMGAIEVQPDRAFIEVSQPKFEFEAMVGTTRLDEQLLIVSNSGTGVMAWQVVSDSNWLILEPASGSCDQGYSDNVWLKVNPAGLAPGQHSCTLSVSDPAAGNSPITVDVELTVTLSCFPDTPQYAGQYADFLQYVANGADPSCWCAPPHGSGYQCDGDADGKANPFTSHRVYTADLALLTKNWKKTIRSADPCADFDHKATPLSRHRVSIGDLEVLISNWMKTDQQLPGDCPREDAP